MASRSPSEIGMDAANRSAMAHPASVRDYERSDYLDDGERILYDMVSSAYAGRPILDVGVGAGRTVPALTAISKDYTAVDYTPAMVEACKKRFPDVRVLLGDARDLSRFPPEHFGLVVFSCAGVDMVGPEDRARIIREVHRVLAHDGAFIFSTHNFASHERPTLRKLFPKVELTFNPVRLARRLLRSLRQGARHTLNHRRLRQFETRLHGHAVLTSHYHEYSTMMHFTTLAVQLGQLKDAGFLGEVVSYSREGLRLETDDPRTSMYHLLARPF